MNDRHIIERAVARYLGDYQTTRDHVAKALFLKAKLRSGVVRRRHALARLHYEARCAIRHGRDREAQRLLEEKARHREQIAELENEIERLENLVADLKNRLKELIVETERLERDHLLSQVIHLSLPSLHTQRDEDLEELRRRIDEHLAERRLEAELAG